MSAKVNTKRQPKSKDEGTESPSEETPPMMEGSQNQGSQNQGSQNQGSQNHIYVGKKPVMSYAMSALIQLSQYGEVNIKARGLAISRAVDVAEIVTRRLGNGTFSVKNINISTEQVKSTETGEMRNVSSIEILVGK
jgi:archaea-specific DNA-binding protein